MFAIFLILKLLHLFHPLSPHVVGRVAALLLAGLCSGAACALPSFDEVQRQFRPSETLVLSREGEVLQRLRTDHQVRRGQWLALADVSPALRTALVLSEDRRFYEHSGVDWQAVSAAAWGNLWHRRTRGASTITMQLAGLLDAEGPPGAGRRTVTEKLSQTVAAQVLERRWRKDQILEAYLNLVPFRGEVVGIDALSRTLFGKAAHGLDEREAAIAAALVRAPNAKAALVGQRACGVWRAMQAHTPLKSAAEQDCLGLELLASASLSRRSWAASEGVAPHFARRAVAQAASTGTVPAQLTTTLRASLQRFAVHTLTQHLRELQGRNVEDGAVVVLDNASGQALAWVGSSGPLSQAAEVDSVLALRQPGSTLKPFLYAQAIAQRRLTAASLIEDSPAHLPTASGLYIPQNYDRQFKGWVSVRTALAASLNVPAVRTLVMVSPDAFFAQLQAVGLPLRESGGYFGYSLALGSSEVALLHLSNAFRTLANGGRSSPVASALLPRQPQTPAWQQALDAKAAFIVGDILSDNNARARTFGTDSVLATRFWSAVKTGTSKDMRDNWAVGWSARYTVGVWVGNASGAAMHDVSGSSGAAPIWAAIMGYLHQRQSSLAPMPPAGVVRVPVQFGLLPGGAVSTPLEAARSEWFVAGTQQALFAVDTGAGAAGALALPDQAIRITNPVAGTILALDPDIPPKHQRLHLNASDAGKNAAQLRWHLNDKPLGQGPSWNWMPWPGRHRITLTDARGTLLDEVRIEVRGAGVRADAIAPATQRGR